MGMVPNDNSMFVLMLSPCTFEGCFALLQYCNERQLKTALHTIRAIMSLALPQISVI